MAFRNFTAAGPSSVAGNGCKRGPAVRNGMSGRLGWVLWGIAGSCGPATAEGPPAYEVRYLGDGWTATGINERGDVCGSVSPDGTSLLAGVSHDGGPFELLPLPPGMRTSRAHDINDLGEIVGSVCANQYVITQPTAAVWRPSADG